MHAQRNKLDRLLKVAKLRLGGVTEQAVIAAQMGVHPSTISRDFAELDARFREQAAQDIAAAKGLDLARTDAMIAAIWDAATRGNLDAIDRIDKLLGRRAKILGLDAPKRIDATLDIRSEAEQLARENGLDEQEVLAAAERIVRSRT